MRTHIDSQEKQKREAIMIKQLEEQVKKIQKEFTFAVAQKQKSIKDHDLRLDKIKKALRKKSSAK